MEVREIKATIIKTKPVYNETTTCKGCIFFYADNIEGYDVCDNCGEDDVWEIISVEVVDEI